MTLFSPLKTSQTKQLRYIFDIGSGSVGGGVARLSEKHSPVLLHTERLPLPFRREPDPMRQRKEMLELLRQVANDLGAFAAQYDSRRGREAHVVLATPWHSAHTHVVALSQEEPIVISKRFLNRLEEEAKAAFRKTLVTSQERSQEDVIQAEQSIVQTRLNGYPTSNPQGKKAHRIEAALFLSMMPRTLKQDIEREIEETFAASSIYFHSFSLVFFLSVRELYRHERDFLLVDVGGEVTNIGLVRDHVLIESISFSWGRNFMLRELARQLGTIPEEVGVFLSAAADRHAADAHSKVEAARTSVEEMWLAAFKKACTDLARNGRLPQRVFLTALADTGARFSNAIGRGESASYTFTGDAFDVVLLDRTALTQRYRQGAGVRPDAFLGLETLFVNNAVVRP